MATVRDVEDVEAVRWLWWHPLQPRSYLGEDPYSSNIPLSRSPIKPIAEMAKTYSGGYFAVAKGAPLGKNGTITAPYPAKREVEF